MVNSSDESPAVVELPDDAIEVIRRRSSSRGYGEPGVTHEEWARSVLAEIYPILAVRVRAEAVADERRRIVGQIERYRDITSMVGTAAYHVGDLAEIVAAGSVPVATPEPLPGCAYCVAHGSDHRRVGSKPFAVWVGRERDSDGAPDTLHVSYAAGHHLGEGEAEFVRRALRSAGPVATPTEPDGAGLIRAERRRQVEVEGWTSEHDERHRRESLALAAAAYATPQDKRAYREVDEWIVPAWWPWAPEWWKPTPRDRVRELVKAGALIAAEIDRLRAASPVPAVRPPPPEGWRPEHPAPFSVEAVVRARVGTHRVVLTVAADLPAQVPVTLDVGTAVRLTVLSP